MKLDKGIDIMLHSIPGVVEKYPNVLFVFIGQTQEYDNEIKSFLNKHQLDNHVRFEGKLEYREMMAHVKAAKLGLTILRSGRNDHAGRGNCRKVFTYMQGAVPQLVTDVGQVGDFVKDNEIGMVIEPDSVKAVTRGILQYLDDPQLREFHGKTGRRAFTDKYNWEEECGRFIAGFNQVMNISQ